jgi:hypothetical protein
MLQELNHPVPQVVTILLNDARKRGKKRQATLIANRKYAQASRDRKKRVCLIYTVILI